MIFIIICILAIYGLVTIIEDCKEPSKKES